MSPSILAGWIDRWRNVIWLREHPRHSSGRHRVVQTRHAHLRATMRCAVVHIFYSRLSEKMNKTAFHSPVRLDSYFKPKLVDQTEIQSEQVSRIYSFFLFYRKFASRPKVFAANDNIPTKKEKKKEKKFGDSWNLPDNKFVKSDKIGHTAGQRPERWHFKTRASEKKKQGVAIEK